MPEQSRLKKPLLYAFVASVLVGALLGIALVVRNQWGWYEVRVIFTTIIIAVASLCGLACDLSRTPRGKNLLPYAGMILTAVAATVALVGMWSDLDSEWFWKSTAVLSILAVATVHVCLLSIARLVRRFQLVYFFAVQIIYGLALLISFMIISEIEGEGMWRVVAALGIMTAAVTLIIPILHRIGRLEAEGAGLRMPLAERNLASLDEEITRLKSRLEQLEKLRSDVAGESGS